MQQIVLMLGTTLALSLGFMLFGLVLRAAAANSRAGAKFHNFDTVESTQGQVVFHEGGLPRGYDTPELREEDNLARFPPLSGGKRLH